MSTNYLSVTGTGLVSCRRDGVADTSSLECHRDGVIDTTTNPETLIPEQGLVCYTVHASIKAECILDKTNKPTLRKALES